MKALKITSLLILLWIFTSISVICFVGLKGDTIRCDVGIVLGAGVHKNGLPSQRLAARLDTAVELYKQGRFAMVIVSGGIDQNGTDEAKAMSDYLEARQIPLSAILVDNQGANTAATARSGAALMKAHQLKSALIISQFFHIARTRLALQANGIQDVHSVYPKHFERRDVYSVLREVVAIPYYVLARQM
jgi:vancomycin permeability regulator SanA